MIKHCYCQHFHILLCFLKLSNSFIFVYLWIFKLKMSNCVHSLNHKYELLIKSLLGLHNTAICHNPHSFICTSERRKSHQHHLEDRLPHISEVCWRRSEHLFAVMHQKVFNKLCFSQSILRIICDRSPVEIVKLWPCLCHCLIQLSASTCNYSAIRKHTIMIKLK